MQSLGCWDLTVCVRAFIQFCHTQIHEQGHTVDIKRGGGKNVWISVWKNVWIRVWRGCLFAAG
jgi:hypothetical protein